MGTDLDTVVGRLRKFHQTFADACSRGIETDQIEPVVNQMLP
jgi:hypothetical protein